MRGDVVVVEDLRVVMLIVPPLRCNAPVLVQQVRSADAEVAHRYNKRKEHAVGSPRDIGQGKLFNLA